MASSNPGKLAEFRLAARLWLEPTGRAGEWVIEPVPDFQRLPACVEDAETFLGNAQRKALHYSRLVSGLVVSDDSGLEVDALNGAPGARSARFASSAATDAENNARLLRELAGLPAEKRTARFVCELALAREGLLLAQFRGVAEGLILEFPRGAGGFGYDPLFVDPQSQRTFAEFSPEEKLRHSHRGRALRAMLDWLAAKGAILAP